MVASRTRMCGAAAAALFFCGFVAVAQGQLSLQALPDVLFVSNSGVHGVELGTVVRARCTASSSSSAPLVTWFRNGSSLANDPPHVRIRNSTSGNEVTSVLTIDDFGGGDDGDYYCQASNSTHSQSSTTLNLTVIDDNSITLFRDPVNFEIIGGNNDAVKMYDSIRDNRTSFTLGQDFEPPASIASCCQTLRCIAAIPGDQLAAANIGLLTVTWLRDEEEIVHSAGRTEVMNDLRYQEGPNETRYVSQLRLISFEASDIGVYQCVYSDFDSDRELVFSSPLKLDTDDSTEALLEAVSPADIVLDPPEKLVIEVESSGGYYRHAWYKNDQEMFPNGDTTFRGEANPERFSEFFQVFVQDPTTTADHGVYRVELIDGTDLTPTVYQSQEFSVTPPVSLSVEALNTTTVTVVEGDDVDISCIATANPLPSNITWSFGGSSTSFSQTDFTENRTAYVPSAGMFSFTEGNTTSTLHITASQYPTHNGTYTCSSSDASTTLSDTITVEVQVPPEVAVSATRSRILIGQSTNISCSVSRTVPTDYTIEWTLTTTGGVTTTLTQTGETLMLTDISEDEFGTYTCNVTNSAGLSGTADITIEEGVAPSVSIADIEAALVGDDVTLNCSATGDTPLVYQWTMQGSPAILNSDNTTGELILMDITESDFGTYICEVSNSLQSTTANITLEQATVPTASLGINVTIVEGETLELMATFEFNLALDSISWERGGAVLQTGSEGVTITNSDLDPPNVTSTLTQRDISRSPGSGSYVVNATNRAGSITATFNVDVFYPPDVSVSATQTRLPVNESTVLTCSVASSNPSDFSVVWTLNDTSGVTSTLSDTDLTLELSSIAVDQFGMYTCNVTNSEGLSGEATITIERGEIPEVTTDGVDPAIPGDDVTLNCSATGDTPLVYQWTMQGSPAILNSDNTTGTLELMDIQESQFGTYVCTVSNDLGMGTSEVTLERAVAPTAGSDESVTFSVGDELVLVAEFSDFNLEIDSIVWTQNPSISLEDGTNGTTITNTDLGPPSANSTLTRSSITGVSYGGTFSATASNRAGSSSANFTVEITIGPDVLSQPESYRFNETTEAELICMASGIPPVAIYWQFEGENITNGPDYTSSNVIELRDDVYLTTSVLTITSVKRSDVGTYTCVAANGVQPDDSVTASLDVNFAPIIEEDPTAESALAPSPVSLSCTAAGEPSPDIVWVKEGTGNETYSESGDGVTITVVKSTSLSMSTLTIDSSDSFDTALYSCKAQNFLGNTTSQAAEVTIFVSPSIQPEEDTYIATEFQVQEVTCTALGVPPPTITFMMGGVVLDGLGNDSTGGDLNERVRLQNQSESLLTSERLFAVNRTLEIVSPVGSDTGSYTCLASFEVLNTTLTATATFDIIVQVAPVIQVTPADVVVISPTTALFYCMAFGVFSPDITWQMNGSPLESGAGIDIAVDTGRDWSNSTLIIRTTVPSDAGNYMCLATNDAGSVNASAQLTVNFAPEVIDPPMGIVLMVNEGMTAVFNCTATGVPGPTITWRRNNVSSDFTEDVRVSLGAPTAPQPVSTPNGTIYSVSRQLSLSNTRDADSGIYFCEASGGEEDILNAELQFQLFVRVAPVITAAPESRLYIRGSSSVFTCDVTGRPRPSITWWREDVSSGELREVTNKAGKTAIVSEALGGEREQTSSLTIFDVQPSDAGVYVCQAENDAGRVEACATLTVHVIPAIDFPPEDYEYDTIQFMETVFECNATGIPAPGIQFFLNGSPLESNETFSILDPVIDTIDISGGGDLVYLVTRRLRINPTLDGDSNIYVCVATNDNGTDSVGFDLIVWVAPEIVDGPDSQIVLIYETAVLTCVSEGRPPPIITWSRMTTDTEGFSIETVMTGARQVVSNLTIQSTIPDYADQYTCRASNLAGNDVASAGLIVHDGPSIDFLLPFPLLIVNQLDPAMFMCNATGIPAPVISWFMGGRPLSNASLGDVMERSPTDILSRVNITDTNSYEFYTPDGPELAVTSVLTIDPTRGIDAGAYRCVASNEIGASMTPAENERNTELYVQVPPVVAAVVGEVIGNESGSATLQFMIADAEPRVELSGLRWFYSDDVSQPGALEEITNLTNRTEESQLVTSFSSDGLFFNITVVGILQERLEGEETDRGRYFLQATNPAGSSEAYVDLEVYGPPLILVPPSDQFVTAGDSAVFSCSALAFPEHHTEWTFVDSSGGATIVIRTSEGNNSKYSIDNSTSSPSFGQLVVLSTQYSDRGQYICTAISEVDSRSASANLTVHVPPVIVSTSPETEIVIDQQVVLVCGVTGFPRPSITWSKDGELLPEESERISIYEFEASVPTESGSGSGISLVGSGLIGSGSITGLIRDIMFSDEDVRGLGELGVVSVLAFETLERGDTGIYTCTAINSLPGGQTETRTVESPPIPLTILEVPDVVENFVVGLVGARWVVLEWTRGFDGNSEILSLRVRVTREDQTRVLETAVTSQDMNSYNVTEAILPFTSYDFQVSVCNDIGYSLFTDVVTVRTEEDAPGAAPTILSSSSPSSTSLLISWRAPVEDQRNGILTDYLVYYTSNTALPMTMWGRTSSPDNSVTLTGLSIFTVYTVSVAASTVAGVGPCDTVEIRTLNDTCSEPFGVVSTGIGETTINLTWSGSTTPNGIVDSYLVSYGIEGTSDGSTVTSDTESLQLVNLDPFTSYTVTVTCVNDAGPGNSSLPITRRTNSAPPSIPDNAIVEISDQPGGRQFVVVFNKPDETNGPISHYHAVAVIVPPDTSLGDPDTDFNSFDAIDKVYSPACGEVSQTTAYIAAEFGSDGFQGNALRFTFGSEEGNPNDRPRYTNGLLCYSTSYAFFLRVYNDVSNNARRSVRQASSDRQYERFSSSGYVTYNTESEPSSGSDNSGTIAGVVVVLIILIVAAVIVAVVIVVIMKKKRVTVYKTHATEAVDFDISFYQQNEHVQLTEYRSPEEGGAGASRQPIAVGQFPSYVEQLHLNENCMFGEEYKAVQDRSAKHPVEACINPDNKQWNRYANIQCFDHSRCVLKAVEGQEHDYINANFIDGYNRHNEYIATQGALPNTVGDFWRLVWDHNVLTIVMLTNLIEKMKVKCSQYWPNADSQTYSDITVTFKAATHNADFVSRTFEVKRGDSDEVRQIHQFHYVTWPDFGVPRHATPVLHFLRRVRDTHPYNQSPPILIHCSAGVGRTGSLIAIDVELQRAQKEGVVDPFNYVLKMREQRNLMVQTEAQYIFLYDAIVEGATSGGTEIPVEGLSSRMKELELVDREGETGYRVEFNRLRQFRVNIREFTDANDNANQFKNRLANALPYNDNRVYLTSVPGVSGSDYINASYIDGYTRRGAFIATQGPLPATVNDFWRMVAEREVQVVVMLTQLEEKGKEMCARYWPEELSATETRGTVSIELLSEESFQDYIHRKIKLDETAKGSLMSRVVHHFQFTAWPENGAPEEGAGMIDIIGQVLRVQQQTGNKPIVIHCSAGIGRTGAFCALSTAIERVKAEGLIDVFHTVKHLRTQRPHMVQTPEQYMFCYRAISEYVSSLDQYSNFV